MKKLLILFIILFAALENYGQFTFGPKIGYTASKLSTDLDSIAANAKSNFQIGAFFRFGKKLYVQPEVFYATSGAKLKQSDSDGGVGEVKLKNISVPVLVGFKLINAKVINLRLMAGPVVNFIIDKKVTASEFYQDPLQDSDFKNAAWGFDLGAGVDVFFLTLDVRYEFGLNNIYIVPDGGQDQTIKSNLFVVSLGFKLM
jgi:hypothetical protein